MQGAHCPAVRPERESMARPNLLGKMSQDCSAVTCAACYVRVANKIIIHYSNLALATTIISSFTKGPETESCFGLDGIVY